ncbi:MAG: NUDIX hydrolase [Thermomicrobium sp.]|nr:NUDIX hydrolase [Thermomicrobium sp.]
MEERLLSRKVVFSGRLLNVYLDEVLLPNGARRVREVVHHPGAVAVLPILDDGRVVLVEQYRHAVGRTLLEVPAGTLEPGEMAESCAARELEEETGYRAGQLRELLRFLVSPGWTDEELVVFVAEQLESRAARPAEDERLTVRVLEPEEVVAAVRGGAIRDAKSLIAVLAYFGWSLR